MGWGTATYPEQVHPLLPLRSLPGNYYKKVGIQWIPTFLHPRQSFKRENRKELLRPGKKMLLFSSCIRGSCSGRNRGYGAAKPRAVSSTRTRAPMSSSRASMSSSRAPTRGCPYYTRCVFSPPFNAIELTSMHRSMQMSFSVHLVHDGREAKPRIVGASPCGCPGSGLTR